jgi:hypothetical protein
MSFIGFRPSFFRDNFGRSNRLFRKPKAAFRHLSALQGPEIRTFREAANE